MSHLTDGGFLKRGVVGRGFLTANRLALLAAVPVFLVFATIAYLTVQFAANENAAQRGVARTYQVISALRQVLGDVQDAESGQRGYLLTRDPAFLAPYRTAIKRVERDIAAFRKLTLDNPDQQHRADALVRLAQARFAALDFSLGSVPQSPGMVEALQTGKQRMDALRAEVAAGMTVERTLLQVRTRERDKQERYEIAFAVGAAVLALGILMIAAALLVRNNLGLSESERARAREAAILQATIDTVRDGIAYFAADGRLSAFNANFFRLMDFPGQLANAQGARLEQLQAVEAGRPDPILT